VVRGWLGPQLIEQAEQVDLEPVLADLVASHPDDVGFGEGDVPPGRGNAEQLGPCVGSLTQSAVRDEFPSARNGVSSMLMSGLGNSRLTVTQDGPALRFQVGASSVPATCPHAKLISVWSMIALGISH
jgi:hypothetical protein